MKHVHRHDPKNQTAGDPKRFDRDPEQLKNQPPTQREGEENESRCHARAPCRTRPLHRRVAIGDYQVCRNHRDRIDDKEERRQRDQRELEDLSHARNLETKAHFRCRCSHTTRTTGFTHATRL